MRKFLKKLLVLTMLLSITIQYYPKDAAAAYTVNGLNAYYISVGKADCILLQQGDLFGLIDTGEADDYTAVKNFLDRKGVQTIQFLIITHLDKDHCDNVSEICRDYKVNNVVYRAMNRAKLSSGYQYHYDEITSVSANKITNCYDGQTLRLGEATIKFYNRQLSFVDDANFANIAETTKINLDSLIFQIVYKSNKFFFLGDSGTSSNNYVSDKYSAAVLKSDVIKVSHHGMSANNTAGIISKVAAKVAINSSSSDFAIEALTTSRLRAANSAVKIYETWNVINYVSTTDQSNTYIGLMVAADGTNIKTYGVYNWGNTSCNKAEVVK